MANWKKVIVSGSNTDLNHITASGDISASGNLFGSLPEDNTIDQVVIYNQTTGQLEFKTLNLVSTVAAPGLFLADIASESNTDFRLSFDSQSITKPITAPFRISASYTLEGASETKTSDNNNNIAINNSWTDADITQQAYYTIGGTAVNITSSVEDRRNGLLTNGSSGYQSSSVTLHLQSVLNTNTAVPEYDTTAAPNLNYGNRAFNDGGVGKLKIYVNTNLVDSPTREIDLTDYDAITSTANGITAALFATQSNKNSVGEIDTTKHYRSGSITINAASTLQNDGYNYAFLLHTGSKNGTDFARITNFQEWFYDLDGNANQMAATAGTTTNPDFSSAPLHYVSGIKYFSGGTSIYRRRAHCTNVYRNIYKNSGGIKVSMDTNLIDVCSVTQSGAHLLTNPTKTAESVSSTETVNLADLADTNQSYLGLTQVTASLTANLAYGTNTFHQPSDYITSPWGAQNSTLDLGTNAIEFENPNKTDKTATSANIQDYMVNRLNSSSTSEAVYEQFRGEDYRIKDISYSVNDDPSSTGTWNSQTSIGSGGTGFNGNLIQYFSHLVYPTKAGAASDGGNFNAGLGPSSNQDYSSLSGERVYLRYFKVSSAQSGNKSINFEFKGSGKVVSSSKSLTTDSNEMHVFFQRLGDNSTSITNSNLTTMIDVINPLVRVGATFSNPADQNIPLVDDEDNISYAGTTVEGISVPTSVVAFSEGAPANVGVLQNEFVIVKIVTPQGWTGYIDAMAIRYGGFADSTTPILQSISTF
jgi:hypothetical protein